GPEAATKRPRPPARRADRLHVSLSRAEGFRYRDRVVRGQSPGAWTGLSYAETRVCRRPARGALLLDAAGGHLDLGVPPAVDQTNFERATRLLVDLRDAVVRRRGAADLAPAVPLESRSHRGREAVDLDPAPIHEPRGLHGGRLDDRGLAGHIREPARH